MKRLLIVSAAIEVGAGVALMTAPSTTATLLVGSPLMTPAALSVGRVGGAGLLALAIACWLARGDAESGAAKGLAAGILVYNLCAVAILGAAGLQFPSVGVALWPAVILHTAMAAWCTARLSASASRSRS